MDIKCVIIDDEPLARKVIETHLKEFQNIIIVGEFDNPIDALSTIEQEKVDVIFLDINMSRINGLEFLKNVPVKSNVIVTTAYREYAAESYDLDVLDYLVKPIPFARFLKSINKLTKQVYLNSSIVDEYESKDSFVFLKVDKKLFKVFYKDILYIESLKEYIKVCTSSGTHIVHKSLTSFSEELPTNEFLRVHRSFTISINKVNSIEGNTIDIGTKRIPIGRKYVNHAKQVLLKRNSL